MYHVNSLTNKGKCGIIISTKERRRIDYGNVSLAVYAPIYSQSYLYGEDYEVSFHMCINCLGSQMVYAFFYYIHRYEW